MRDIAFYLGLGALFTHELDAMPNHEWRGLPLLGALPDETAMWVFVAAHVPLFAVLVALVASTNARTRPLSRLGVGTFLLVHGLLHALSMGQARAARHIHQRPFQRCEPAMRRLLLGAAILVGLALLLVLGHLALIEVGREVVTLRTQRPDGTWQGTRLWIVDDGGSSWLHSAGADWLERFAGDPVVEMERAGAIRRYRAHALPGPHPRVHQLLREKYGLADRWVRLVGPDNQSTVVVRLDPL